MDFNKRGDTRLLTKHIVYWILIAFLVVIIWVIIQGIIKKLLTLY